jgi:hypothetical protein
MWNELNQLIVVIQWLDLWCVAILGFHVHKEVLDAVKKYKHFMEDHISRSHILNMERNVTFNSENHRT